MLRMAISAGTGRDGLAAWARRLPPVDFVLVREKALAGGELVAACREVKASLPTRSRILVAGGRADVALAAGLDGVHLGAAPGELRVAQVRQLLPEAWVSVSCHRLDEVRRAKEQMASAVLFAPVFGKVVDGLEVVGGAGLESLREACQEAGHIPVFALGGVTDANTAQCAAAGAAGIAGIGMFRSA